MTRAESEIAAHFYSACAPDVTADWLHGVMTALDYLAVGKEFQRQAMDFAIRFGGGHA